MTEYHKIQSIFKRDPANKMKTFLIGEYSEPEFEYLKDCLWVFTEKIDGTNIRVMWDGQNVRFGGRTNLAQIHTFLLDFLLNHFTPELMLTCFGELGGITLYGEGYGNRINKVGSKYLNDRAEFILFDIAGGDVFFERSKVEEYGKALDLPVTPIVDSGSLDKAVEMCRNGFPSIVGDNLVAEGLVMRPIVELRDRMGDRIITKVKCRDFEDAKK